MKFTVCGSGDAIGVPGVFCRCANCMSARRNGGREKRSRTGFLLGNTIKFDFGPDTPMQAREQGFDLAELKYLFVTHSHSDHFCPEELWNQTLGIFREEPVLTVFGNAATLAALASYHAFGIPIRSRLLHSGETVRIGPVEVTAIATKHIPTEECLMYLIETPGENVLIATDSDRFPESAYTLLQGHRVDHLFIDATWGGKTQGERGAHGAFCHPGCCCSVACSKYFAWSFLCQTDSYLASCSAVKRRFCCQGNGNVTNRVELRRLNS